MELLKVALKYFSPLRFVSKSTPIGAMKYLNVAEKNDAAKNIAAILSRGASTRVCAQYHLYYISNCDLTSFSERVSHNTIKFMNSMQQYWVNRHKW